MARVAARSYSLRSFSKKAVITGNPDVVDILELLLASGRRLPKPNIETLRQRVSFRLDQLFASIADDNPQLARDLKQIFDDALRRQKEQQDD